MSFPALSLAQLQSRTVMPLGDVNIVETNQPGFTVQRIATQTSWLYSRLRKRYGKTIPFGQTAPLLVPSGLNPPNVLLIGRPTLGAYLMQIQITTGGALGTAIFQWSSDGGATWTTGVTTSAVIPLGTTGMSATFPVGTYDTSNLYAAATPIAEAFLDWLTVLVTLDLYWKRGSNPQDPALVSLTERRTQVLEEVKEAADSNTGLFDLPISEDEGSSISTGFPLGSSQASPYVWTDAQEARGAREDSQSYGDWGGYGR
jgi:hypothetical protein